MNRNDTIEFLQTEFAVEPDLARRIAEWLERRDAEREDVARAIRIKHASGISSSPGYHTYHMGADGTDGRTWTIQAPNLGVAIWASLSYAYRSDFHTQLKLYENGVWRDMQTPEDLESALVAHEHAIRTAYKTIKED